MLSLHSIAALVNRAPNVLLVIPMWLLAAVAFRQVFSDGGGPPWDYLWDDEKNFTKNPHMKLNLANVRWAFRDGAVLGVYEPVSLVIKQVLHTFIKFDARMYRLVNFVAHLINMYLAFSVGRKFLYSVNDYSFHAKKIADLIAEKERTSNSESERNGKSSVSQKSEIKTWLQHAQASLSCLKVHDALGTFGCMMGISVFAVHPLQAQAVGWASCMSYFFSCFFALLSFDSYVKHRAFMREWRRTERKRLGTISRKNNISDNRISEKLWRISLIKGADKRVIQTDEPETWMLSNHKVASIVFYVLATFCKSPAVTLPMVFIIIDVFVYSSPLSVHPSGLLALQGSSMTRIQNKPKYLSRKLLPSRVLSAFFRDTLPKLFRLTVRAVKAQAMFVLVIPIEMALLVGGNDSATVDDLSLIQKTERASMALAWYLWKFFIPSKLVAQVEMQSFSFLDHWEVALSLALIPFGTLAILTNSLSSTPMRLIACSWAVFVALLLPSLGFVQHGRTILAADRYMYIPLVMMGPILGAIVSAWYTVAVISDIPVVIGSTYVGGPVPDSVSGAASSSKAIDSFDASCVSTSTEGKNGGKSRSGKVIGAKSNAVGLTSSNGLAASRRKPFTTVLLTSTASILALVFISATYLTPSLLCTWRNTQLLWERNVNLFPNSSSSAHVNLIPIFTEEGENLNLDKALYHAKAALSFRPGSPKYMYNLALVHMKRNELDEAKEFAVKCLYGNPTYPFARWMHKLYAQILRARGEYEESQREYETAISMGEHGSQEELDSLLVLRHTAGAVEATKETWSKDKVKVAAKQS